MSIELTEQQHDAIEAQAESPPRVIDPRTRSAYYLVPEADYDAVRELLDDARKQKAIRAVARRNAAGRLGE